MRRGVITIGMVRGRPSRGDGRVRSVGAAASSASSVPLGDYSGADNPGGVADFGTTTGTHPTLATDFLNGSSTWAVLDGAVGYRARGGSSGYRLVLAVPMLPKHARSSLAKGAGVPYNSYFVTLAHNLVNAGEGNAYLRLGVGVQRELVQVERPQRQRCGRVRALLPEHRERHAVGARPVVQVRLEPQRRQQPRSGLQRQPGLSRKRLCGLHRHRSLRRVVGPAPDPGQRVGGTALRDVGAQLAGLVRGRPWQARSSSPSGGWPSATTATAWVTTPTS